MKNNFLLSVIIPVFNEEGNIDPLLDKLVPIISNYNYEIVFVDDGSKDATSSEIKRHTDSNKNIKLLSFLRNFGHQTALSAGYQVSQGDCVVSIDADLQDPPELIHDMIQKWQEGSKVVYAKRSERHESFFKTVTAHGFYLLINQLSNTAIPENVGDYRLIDREVVDMLNNMPERSRFLRGLVAWGGYPSAYITFTRKSREIGQTHYPFSKMFSFAINGIISFSTKPLRFASYLGLITSFIGFFGMMYAIYRRIFLPSDYWVPGWTATFVSIMFFGGVQLLTIGIIGEYIGKIYNQLQGRPQYIVKEKINL